LALLRHANDPLKGLLLREDRKSSARCQNERE
jgi:hypothetical protein